MANTSNQTSTLPFGNHIYFLYQSHSIPFADWIAIFTLCLAPLLTHVAFGYATPVLLDPSRRNPSWRDRLPQFNPITIIWRWYAILNRRARAVSWDRSDMAISNAIFWDGYRWIGSEDLMSDARNWIIKEPSHKRVNWVSSSSLATIAMTLQGVAAVIRLKQATSRNWTKPTTGLPDIFFPMAVLAFARLPVSPWLSKEYGFDRKDDHWSSHGVRQVNFVDPPLTNNDYSRTETGFDESSPVNLIPNHPIQGIEKHLRAMSVTKATTDILQQNIDNLQSITPRLEPSNTFLSRMTTLLTILLTLAFSMGGSYISMLPLVQSLNGLQIQLSTFLTSLFYIYLSIPGGLIVFYYIFRGRQGETVIPCMNSTWFRWWNGVLMCWAIAMVIVSALEMRKRDCGGESVGCGWETYGIPL